MDTCRLRWKRAFSMSDCFSFKARLMHFSKQCAESERLYKYELYVNIFIQMSLSCWRKADNSCEWQNSVVSVVRNYFKVIYDKKTANKRQQSVGFLRSEWWIVVIKKGIWNGFSVLLFIMHFSRRRKACQWAFSCRRLKCFPGVCWLWQINTEACLFGGHTDEESSLWVFVLMIYVSKFTHTLQSFRIFHFLIFFILHF